MCMVDSFVVPKKPDEERELPTMRVRVRAKNPQIGRKLSGERDEDKTALHEEDVAPPPAKPVRVSAMMDDDATEIASGPPGLPTVAFMERGNAQDPSDSAPPEMAEPEVVERVAPSERDRVPPTDRDGTVRGRPPAPSTPSAAPPSSAPPAKRPGGAVVEKKRVRKKKKKPSRPAGPMPRGRMVMSGTKAAGALAAKVRIQRLERELPDTDSPELKLLRTHMDPDAIRALDQALHGRQEDRDIMRASASPKRALERLIHGAMYTELEIPDRARLLEPIAAAPNEVDTINAARRLIDSGVVGACGNRARGRLLDLFGELSDGQRIALAEVAERELRGKSALLDRDFEDTSIVEHLAAIACAARLGNGLQGVGYSRPQALGGLFSQLSDPPGAPADEGADGLLGTLELALASYSPAEHARLWRGLVLGELSVDLPSDGRIDLAEALRSQPGMVVGGHDTPLRLGLEQLAGLAHPRGGPRRTAFIMPGGNCVDADVTARALGFLYGIGFTVAAGAPAAMRQLSSMPTNTTRVPPIFVTVLYDGGERLFIFDSMDDDRVYLCAPRGTSTKPRGSRRLDPMRRVEDPRRGRDSIPRADFEESVGVALVPRT